MPKPLHKEVEVQDSYCKIGIIITIEQFKKFFINCDAIEDECGSYTPYGKFLDNYDTDNKKTKTFCCEIMLNKAIRSYKKKSK